MKSTYALIIVVLVWAGLGLFFYPKWAKELSEATISWDASGYYHYLPAIFIYKDIRQQTWMDQINQKYIPSPAYDQAFVHPASGNKVNKYSIGQAIMYTPFFLAAHTYTKLTNAYPADGYSRPYQIAIWFGGLLISILGLFLLRHILNGYFNDHIVGWVLLSLGLGTNWMEYASITNAMNHTWLFTLLCVLILSTIRFYQKYDWMSVVCIGTAIGLAVLTRPTEIVWVMIPLLWGIQSIKARAAVFTREWKKCIVAILIAASILSIQLIYWKYATGDWFVYSYGNQHFQWLHPKIWRGLMGVNMGWWMYTPIMLFAMIGWYKLYRMLPSLFWPTFITGILSIYITLSWPHWETGGGLGQRNLIQVYPLFAFALIPMISWMAVDKFRKILWWIFLGLNIYYSFWWVYQAHRGGFFVPGQMTTPYFYGIVGRMPPDPQLVKLMDTDELFKGTPNDVREIYIQDFEKDSFGCVVVLADSTKAACLNASNQFIGPIGIPLSCTGNEWIRCEADFNVQTREWNFWMYAQWMVQFYKGDTLIKSNMIRIHRLVSADFSDTHVYFDVRIPGDPYDQCRMTFWNAESSNTILVDRLKVSCFRE